MSISESQAREAEMFLRVLKQAQQALQIGVVSQEKEERIRSFGEEISARVGRRRLHAMCDLNKTDPRAINSSKDWQLLHQIRSFQFSHYIFTKYLYQIDGADLKFEQIVQILHQANESIAHDIQLTQKQ